MLQLSEYEKNALRKLGESIHEGKWSNEGMVQLIELTADYLNPVPLLKYAAVTGMSYNGVKKRNIAKTIINQKYIIDNE